MPVYGALNSASNVTTTSRSKIWKFNKRGGGGGGDAYLVLESINHNLEISIYIHIYNI